MVALSKPEASGADSAEVKAVITSRVFAEGSATHEAALDELRTLAADDERFVWVDLNRYHAPDLEAVAAELDLPQSAVQTAVAERMRPRIDVYGEHFFVSVAVPRRVDEGQEVLLNELDLFVGRNYLVSAHRHPLPFTERALARAVQNPVMLKLDSAFLLSILIDELLATYEELTEELEDAIEAIEERALVDESDAFLNDLLMLKRYVFAVFHLVGKQRAIVEAFLRPDFPLAGGAVTAPYFRDLDDRLGHLVDRLGAAKESVNGAFDLYVSQVSRRTNDIMKVLAIVSTMLLPASVILAFFGTSLLPSTFETETWFFVMIVLVVIVTTCILFLFYRWRWIGRSLALQAKRPRRLRREA
jgi:magnesium transporter